MTLRRVELPVDLVLADILSALDQSSSLVIQAPPGAGKTTRVPPALAAQPQLRDGLIIMVQPRRLAARTSAARIAWENHWELGKEVGYQVRFEKRSSSQTKILVVTEGVLLRRLQIDPILSDVSAVILDEFHERRLDTDLLLGMLWRVQQSVRPELRLVVMSATLDAAPVASFLQNAPIVESQGRMFPVQIQYQRSFQKVSLVDQVVETSLHAIDKTEGDILAFLPGVGEIHSAARMISQRTGKLPIEVMPLYADLSPEQQDRVLAPNERRKIILATNVAETSITIDGIRVVIDSGMARVLRQDPQICIDRLQLEPISKASADQRAGRAGRTSTGVCFRLWDEASHRSRPDFTDPEIRRVDLASAVLQLHAWGEDKVLEFPWLEKPRVEWVNQAEALLHRIGALHQHKITPLGKKLSTLPVHPRIARMLVESQKLGYLEPTALAAAILSERDPIDRRAASSGSHSSGGNRPPPPTRARLRSTSDLLERVDAIYSHLQTGRVEFEIGTLRSGSVNAITRAAEQYCRLLGDSNEGSSLQAEDLGEALGKSLLAAFPDRVARRRDRAKPRALMVGGRGVKLAPESTVTDAELFVCVDVGGDGSGDANVRLASAVELEWLDGELLSTRDELFYNPTQHQVVARRRKYWDDLVLDETPVAANDAEQVAEILAREAIARWEQVFPKDDESVTGFIQRVMLVRKWMPQLELPSFEPSDMHDVLKQLCLGRRSLAELKGAPWRSILEGYLTNEQLSAVNRHAPERIQMPAGHRARIIYEAGKSPVLASRIQDFFGWTETPRIVGGNVRLQLHLLAPSKRVQQITEDLASFWANTYDSVRKELKRRYPKHSWPEDPLKPFRED